MGILVSTAEIPNPKSIIWKSLFDDVTFSESAT